MAKNASATISLDRVHRPSLCGMRSVVVLLVVAVATAVCVVLLIPHTSTPSLLSSSTQTTAHFDIPFQHVDRTDFGDPVQDFIDMDLFHPSLINANDDDAASAFVFPFPTGAFWTNLVVQEGGNAAAAEVSYPVAVYPYAYRWSAKGAPLQVSYPAIHRVDAPTMLQDTFAPDLQLSTLEPIHKRHVTQFDPLSVTLRFVASSDSKWETALVQGSPYVTLQYLTATPVISPLSIFSKVQCPGDETENFSDMVDDNESDDNTKDDKGFLHHQRRLFGVCSIDVSVPSKD